MNSWMWRNKISGKVVWLTGVALIALSAFCLLALLAWSGREPSYQGRSLNQWLAGLEDGSGATNVTTITALRAMGAKAAVRVVPMLEASDSPYKLRLLALLQKQSLVKVPFIPASVKQQRAERAFELMGEGGLAAAPGLVSILTRRGEEPPEYLGDPAGRAARALRCLGHNAIPYLRPALCSAHARVRTEAIGVLVGYSYEPGASVEVLKLLDDADPRARAAAAYAAGKARIAPQLAIPRLVQVLADGEPSARKQAAFALGQYGTQASNALAALQKTCFDAVPNVRQAAETAVVHIGGAVPAGAGQPGLRDEK